MKSKLTFLRSSIYAATCSIMMLFGSVAAAQDTNSIMMLFGSVAAAQDTKIKKPQIFVDVVECRSIADDSARLACYDEKVAALDTAQKEEKLVVADREDVQEAKRGLFGLSIPRIKLFSGSKDNEINEITSTVKSVSRIRYGNVALVLEDGSKWNQTDGKSLGRGPQPGQTIVIKRAALGSFTAKVNNKRSFRIKRIN